MRTATLTLTLTALLCLALATPAQAQWSTRPEDALLIAGPPAATTQVFDARKLGCGDFLVVFQCTYTQPFDQYTIICVQRITPEGRKLWGEDGIPISPSDSIQYYPKVVDDNSGGVFVFWWDARGTLPNKEIYGQHISAQGEFLWEMAGRLIITPNGISPGYEYAACPDGEDGAYLVWGDDDVGYYLWIQRMDGRGSPLWPRNVRAAQDARDPKICLRSGGGCYILWGLATAQGLRAQRFDPNGRALWPPNGILFNDLFFSAEANIISDGGGGFLYRNMVFIARFSERGQLLWNNAVSQYSVFTQCLDFKLAPNGLIYAVYRAPIQEPLLDSDVYAQCFDLEGNMLWGRNGRPVCALRRYDVGWAFMALTSFGFITRFTSFPYYVPSEGDDYFQISDSAGHVLLEPRGRPLYISPIYEGGQVIISDGHDGAIAFIEVWPENPDSSLANRILPDGSLGYPPISPPVDQPRGKILSLSEGLLRYSLPQAGEVKLELFDLLGRRVSLVEEGRKEMGEHAARLPTEGLTSGFYILRLTAPGWREASRVLVVR